MKLVFYKPLITLILVTISGQILADSPCVNEEFISKRCVYKKHKKIEGCKKKHFKKGKCTVLEKDDSHFNNDLITTHLSRNFNLDLWYGPYLETTYELGRIFPDTEGPINIQDCTHDKSYFEGEGYIPYLPLKANFVKLKSDSNGNLPGLYSSLIAKDYTKPNTYYVVWFLIQPSITINRLQDISVSPDTIRNIQCLDQVACNDQEFAFISEKGTFSLSYSIQEWRDDHWFEIDSSNRSGDARISIFKITRNVKENKIIRDFKYSSFCSPKQL